MGEGEHQMNEQLEMVQKVNEIRNKFRGRGLSWNRLRGDAITRVVAHYLQGHLPKGVKLVRLAWVEGCSSEFDILIVDEDAEPIGFTGAYPKDKVRLMIEVKGSGVFYRKGEVEQKMSELFKSWRDLTGKPILYLSFWHRFSYANLVLNALGEDTAFILEIEKVGIKQGEWERFIQRLSELIKV